MGSEMCIRDRDEGVVRDKIYNRTGWLSEHMMLRIWRRTAKRLITVLATRLFINVSQSVCIPRPWTYFDGMTTSEQTDWSVCDKVLQTHTEVQHGALILAVFSCTRCDLIHRDKSLIHAAITQSCQCPWMKGLKRHIFACHQRTNAKANHSS